MQIQQQVDLNLHQLKIFRIIANEGSITRAAGTLFLSQPGVSLQLKALEKALGIELFKRTGRQLKLTEAGRELLGYAERIFSLIDETVMVMGELAGARRGTVRIAASTTAGIYVVPPALGEFHRQNPTLKLTLDVVNRHAVQETLLNDEVDIGVMGLIEDAHDLDVKTFAPNQLVVIAAPSHRLVGQKQIPLEELADEIFLLREQGSGTRDDVERLFRERSVPLQVGMELRSSGAIKQAVAADLGVAVMPEDAIMLEMQADRLAVLDVAGFPVTRYWSLVRRKGRHLSYAAEQLWNHLLAARDATGLQFPEATAV